MGGGIIDCDVYNSSTFFKKMNVYPAFEKQNEFVYDSYYNTSQLQSGELFSLKVSRGLAKRSIYWGILPYQNDILNLSHAPRALQGEEVAKTISKTETITSTNYSPTLTGLQTPAILGIDNVGRYQFASRMPNDGEDSNNSTGYQSPSGPFGAQILVMATQVAPRYTHSLTHNDMKVPSSVVGTDTETLGGNKNYKNLGSMQFQAFLQFRRDNQNLLTMPLCTDRNAQETAKGGKFAISLYGNSQETSSNSLKISKYMTIDTVLADHNMIIKPFDFIIDADEVLLIVPRDYSTPEIFLFLGCFSQTAI